MTVTEQGKLPPAEAEAPLEPVEGEIVNGNGNGHGETAIAKADQVPAPPVTTALARPPTFTTEQIQLFEQYFRLNMPTYKDGNRRELQECELATITHRVRVTGLDPLSNQICVVWRWDSKINDYRMTIQTQIDGFRLIAARTREYAGSEEPTYTGDGEKQPGCATVTVYRMVQGVRCPFTAAARWAEYMPGGEMAFMWKSKPYLMLGKCAEALALRKAFPAELSGLYTNDEMHQADMPDPADAPLADRTAPKADSRDTRANRGTITEDDIQKLRSDPYWPMCVKAWGPEKAREHYTQSFKTYCMEVGGEQLENVAGWTWAAHDTIAAKMASDPDPTPPSERE